MNSDFNLLDMLARENARFLSASVGFGEKHVIDGREVVIALDNDALRRRADRSGVHLGDLMYFAAAGDFERVPQVGTRQMFDGRATTVEEVTEDCGMLTVVLSQNRG